MTKDMQSLVESTQDHSTTQNAHFEVQKVKVNELKKKMSELALLYSDSFYNAKTMEEELEVSRKKLEESKDVISNLKCERSNNDQEKQRLQDQIQSDQKELALLRNQIDSQSETINGLIADISERDDQITELNKKNIEYISEISELQDHYKMKEKAWGHEIGKLKVQVKAKGKSNDDLNRILDDYKLDKNRLSALIDTLQTENASKDNLVQELDTRENLLQVRLQEVLNDIQKVKNEQTLNVEGLELMRQVQLAIITDAEEAKSQLASSLEDQKARCEDLLQAYIEKGSRSLSRKGDKSKSQLAKEDSLISPENVEGFEEHVKVILKAIEQDRDFSEMTAENYDHKKSFLKVNVNVLSRMHRALADQHIDLIREVRRECPSLIKEQHLVSKKVQFPSHYKIPAGIDIQLSYGRGGFDISEREGSESSVPLLVTDNVLEVKESEDPEDLHTKISSMEEERVSLNEKLESLADENNKLKQEIQEKESDFQSQQNDIRIQKADLESKKEKVIELEKQVADLKLQVPPVSDDSLKVKETEVPEVLHTKISNTEEERVSFNEELESLAEENSKLKQKIQEKESELQSQQNDIINQKADLENEKEKVTGLQKQVADLKKMNYNSNPKMKTMGDELKASEEKIKKLDGYMSGSFLGRVSDNAERDDQIRELNMQIKQYTSEISQLKSAHEQKEYIRTPLLRKLKEDLKEKCDSVDDLNKKLAVLKLEKDGINAQLNKLRAENCSQDNTIQELKTRLDSVQVENVGVQVENVGVLPSFENVQKLTNELKQKVVELEMEVGKQREATSDRA